MLPQGTSFMTPQGVTQKAYLRSVMVPSSNPNGVYFVKDASGKVFQCKTVRSANETPIQIHPNSAAANHGKGVQIITSGNVPVFVKSATPLKMANCLPMKVGPEKKEDELKSSGKLFEQLQALITSFNIFLDLQKFETC